VSWLGPMRVGAPELAVMPAAHPLARVAARTETWKAEDYSDLSLNVGQSILRVARASLEEAPTISTSSPPLFNALVGFDARGSLRACCHTESGATGFGPNAAPLPS
jgi:hypothetical protein